MNSQLLCERFTEE